MNVLSAESRRRPGLPLEALQGLRVGRELVGQELQRDLPAQPRVLRPVNDPHAAAAELLDNAVARNRLADHFAWESAMKMAGF